MAMFGIESGNKYSSQNGLDLKVSVNDHIVVMIMKTYQGVIVKALANDTHSVHFACVILATSGNCYSRSQPCRALGDREVDSSSKELLFTSSSTCASLFFLKFLPILGHSLLGNSWNSQHDHHKNRKILPK